MESENREYLEYPGLTILLKYNVVDHIVGEQGYEGRTPDGLKVGVSWKELRQTHPNITFHADEYLWYMPGINGLSFDIVRPP